MQHRLSSIDNYYNGSSSDPCHHSLMELACGLQATPCDNGQAVPVCREHCESKIRTSLISTGFLAQFVEAKSACRKL
ncbi:hypothetical protein DPMN_170535 [Dreissena polymorpha]|uniref:FZ domain-containing protein n=1 Tax=Dreissena polymorpha TaxID=45954 RepID=A0A9D4DYS6_DREPO|nr:hypothetical protein DPMN_170535 [Dreissena polymorpha]